MAKIKRAYFTAAKTAQNWAAGPRGRKVIRFTKRYSRQLSFAALLIAFLTVTVGEGQADAVNTPVLAAQIETTQDGFLGKPQVLSDQTITTGEVQQQLAIVYSVEKGDSVTSIANRYDLSPGSILDANHISYAAADQIKTGDQIIIPASDTNTSATWLASLNTAKAKQKAEVEAAYQAQLAAAAKHKTPTGSTRVSNVPVNAVIGDVVYLGTFWGTANGAVPGQCTAYVNANHRFPGPMGNANQYLARARSYGLATGGVPRVGSVGVTNESALGHVVLITAVSGNSVTFREENYLGVGKVDQRTASLGLFRGFVY